MKFILCFLLVGMLSAQVFIPPIPKKKSSAVAVVDTVSFVHADTLGNMAAESASPVLDTSTHTGGTSTYSIATYFGTLTFGAGRTYIDSVTVDSANGIGSVKLDSLSGTGYVASAGASAGIWQYGTKNVKAGLRVFRWYIGSLISGTFSVVEFDNVNQTTPVDTAAQATPTQTAADTYINIVNDKTGDMLVSSYGTRLATGVPIGGAQTVRVPGVVDAAGGPDWRHYVTTTANLADSVGFDISGLDDIRFVSVRLNHK